MNEVYITRTGRNDWETPPDFFRLLDSEFKFTLDPCCEESTAKCPRFFTLKENGLIQSWEGERVYVNPPYNDIPTWLAKGIEERDRAEVIVYLIPARVDTVWFHDLVMGIASEIRFIRGRLKFVGAESVCPFPCMVVVYRPVL